ncbi:hypothetical protein BAY61_18515 [Prauserella marina]|nr:hypothetical protein BAY61_18515 [Prauserella marina]
MVVDHDQVLLGLRHSDRASFPGAWDPPGDMSNQANRLAKPCAANCGRSWALTWFMERDFDSLALAHPSYVPLLRDALST